MLFDWLGARPRCAGLFTMLALALTGCASELGAGDDVRIVVRADRLYVVTSERATVRSLCAGLGQGPSRAEPAPAAGARTVADDGRETGAPQRCSVRSAHIIVCADGDQACVAHEERHAREGNFHR